MFYFSLLVETVLQRVTYRKTNLIEYICEYPGLLIRKTSRKDSNPHVLLQDTLQTSPPGCLTSLQMFNQTYKLYSYRFVLGVGVERLPIQECGSASPVQ